MFIYNKGFGDDDRYELAELCDDSSYTHGAFAKGDDDIYAVNVLMKLSSVATTINIIIYYYYHNYIIIIVIIIML